MKEICPADIYVTTSRIILLIYKYSGTISKKPYHIIISQTLGNCDDFFFHISIILQSKI